MDSLVDKIRVQGTLLGSPNLKTLARFELARLRRQTPVGRTLVAVYGNREMGFSISPLDNLETLRACRRAPGLGMSCSYYAIPDRLISR